MNRFLSARLHRFQDRVAVTITGESHTRTPDSVYLTARQALELAEYLQWAARDIADFPNFAESRFPSHEIDPEAGE